MRRLFLLEYVRNVGGTTNRHSLFVPLRDEKAFFIGFQDRKEILVMSIGAELQETVAYSPLHRMRHSAAHIMAQAIQEMFPDAKFAIGPAIEDGFYYDFELPRALTPEDFPEIEQRMARIIAGKYPFAREIWSRQQALQYFRERGQNYKVEIIEGLPEKDIGPYEQRNGFPHLCHGEGGS